MRCWIAILIISTGFHSLLFPTTVLAESLWSNQWGEPPKLPADLFSHLKTEKNKIKQQNAEKSSKDGDLSTMEPSYFDEPINNQSGRFWEGFYAGVHLGYGSGEMDHQFQSFAVPMTISAVPEGLAGGLTIGWNKLLAKYFLIGLEGDIGMMDWGDEARLAVTGERVSVSYGNFWGTIRARAGITYDRFLIYGTGGIAFIKGNEFAFVPATGAVQRLDNNRTGLVIGAGIEYALSDQLTGKIEYLHMDFGKEEGVGSNGSPFTYKSEFDLVRLGLNYHF